MTHTYRIAVLGGGSFGTTLCNLVADNGHHAMLWLRNAERAEESIVNIETVITFRTMY